MNWQELHKMKVSDLRELAKEKTEIEGVSGLHKEQLVERVAAALGIPRPHKVVEAEGKTAIKHRIRELKHERDDAIAAHDSDRLHEVRKLMHVERRRLHRMAHLTH